MKETLGPKSYDNYKATMGLYLTPNNLCNRGRFCCAYCEMIFTDQWSLEKVCDVRCINDPMNEFRAFFSIYILLNMNRKNHRLIIKTLLSYVVHNRIAFSYCFLLLSAMRIV